MGQRIPHKAFRGRYYHTIDGKGRLSIPSQFREVLNQKYKEDKLVITSLVNSLVAYPMSEWIALEEKISKLPQMKPEVRRFQLFFVSGATECAFDKQGRILVPVSLREEVGLRKDVVVVGMITKFEIWDRERWEKEIKLFKEDPQKFNEILAELGI